MGSDDEAMGLRAVPDIREKDHDQVRRHRSRDLPGFSGLNAAEAAASKPSATPAAAKPAAVKPAATPAASKTTTTAFGTGVWRTVKSTPPNPVTHVSSSANLYISFGATRQFTEEIVAEGGNGKTGAGGMIDIVGTYKKLSATRWNLRRPRRNFASVYCQAYEPARGARASTLPTQTLAPGEIQGAGGADWTEIEP